ncbi:MAG: ABC transporter permease [Spirosomataceae bacterium]
MKPLIDKLLRRLIAPHLREEIFGDLHERYALRVKRLSQVRARQRYWRDALTYVRWSNIKRKPNEFPTSYLYSPTMIRNYFKIALRTLTRHKLYTALNVAGLTFGITCFLLIGLYLFDELTFDQLHRNASRIYRVIEHKKTKTDDLTIAAVSYKLAEESKKSIPEVENTARITEFGRDNLANPETKSKFHLPITVADENFMKVFDFETIAGENRTALKEPNSIVITEAIAKKLFNNTEAVGKTLKFDFSDKPLKITAVIKNHPSNSSFDFGSLLSESTFNDDADFQKFNASDWSSHQYIVYALLKENARPEAVGTKINSLIRANFKPEAGTTTDYTLQPLTDMHLHSGHIAGEAAGQSSILYIKIFAAVALFVLLIACINYMNLTTARASNRSKEIGVRKANGAFRSHLINQFLFESLLVTLLSFTLSVLLVNLLLPSFNAFTQKQLSLGLHSDYRIWLYTLTAVLLTALLSGSYPAFLLSRFSPLSLLKNLKLHNKGDMSLRKGLVVFQFTISVVMIIGTIVLFQQIQYVSNKDLGFDKELLLVVDINSGEVRKNAQTIKNEFSKIPTVKNVAVTTRVPGEWKNIPTVKIGTEGNTDEHKISYLLGVDEHFAATFEIKVINGRNFTGTGDSTSVLLNETAAKSLNISEAAEQLIEIPERSMGGSYGPLNNRQTFRARVVGIVKDFHFQSLREKIAPMVLAYQNNPVHSIDYFTSRITGNDIPTTLAKMNETLTKIDPSHLLEYHFLDEQLALFYAEDQRRESMLIWAAMATIFIACLGLFGLATYTAEQRIKEIGVRKVLGASVFNLTALLSKDFLKLVLIANGIAFPLAWWATRQWLEEFAYHISVEWWVFLLAGLSAVVIALLTISYQAIKAALMNPVKSLKTE